MKPLLKLFLSAWLILGLVNCDFLDVVPDERASFDDAFEDEAALRRFLFSCYAYNPDPRHQTSSLDFFTSDEVATPFDHETMQRFPRGQYTATSPVISYWNSLFQAIRQCYILINNIDRVPGVSQEVKDDYVTREFLEGVIEEFKKRKLFERVRNASAVYTEVPFSYKVLSGGSYSGNTFEQDTYVNGTIDLVFKESGKWVIIDYKTYDEKESSHEIRSMYEPQLNAYKDVWESLTGETVSETEIFFVMKRFAG